MTRTASFIMLSAVIAATGVFEPALAGEQEAIDGCIDQLRTVGSPDTEAGGEVLSSEFSEAATLVMLRDAGGTVWRCLAYSDGTVGELSVNQAADDGAGVMAGAPVQSNGGEPTTTTELVQFDPGSTGAELTATLMPGGSARYILGAKEGQNLYVRVATKDPDIYYQIFNPDQSFLLDQMTSNKEYRGQLWQSGDHVIEVINRGNSPVGYNVIFGID